jgi:hypothetical protein
MRGRFRASYRNASLVRARSRVSACVMESSSRPRLVSRYWPRRRVTNPRASSRRRAAKTRPSRTCRARAVGCGYLRTNQSKRVSDMPQSSRLARGSSSNGAASRPRVFRGIARRQPCAFARRAVLHRPVIETGTGGMCRSIRRRSRSTPFDRPILRHAASGSSRFVKRPWARTRGRFDPGRR